MNYIYVGRSTDLNVGNGKSVSIVGATIDDYINSSIENGEENKKTIFSNIKLKGIEYQEFHPGDITNVLNTKNALVILDELHAIVHKNHRISESCGKHEIKGLCYRLSEFFRQVRKRGIDTRSSCQTFSDAPFQYRQLMQEQILCEKFNIATGKLRKCDTDRCPQDHEHIIKQTYFRNGLQAKEPVFFDPSPYYEFYDSYEIVDGWVSYE